MLNLNVHIKLSKLFFLCSNLNSQQFCKPSLTILMAWLKDSISSQVAFIYRIIGTLYINGYSSKQNMEIFLFFSGRTTFQSFQNAYCLIVHFIKRLFLSVHPPHCADGSTFMQLSEKLLIIAIIVVHEICNCVFFYLYPLADFFFQVKNHLAFCVINWFWL